MKLLSRISPAVFFLFIALVYLTGYLSHALYLGKTVYGDGAYYYAWMTGAMSKFSVGPAIFWTPVYTLTHNEIAVGAVGVLASLFGLVLLYHTLTKYFSKMVAIMTVTLIAGATNLLFYGSLDTVNSHALTFFAVSVYIALLVGKRHWFATGCALGAVGLMRTQDLVYALLLVPYVNRKNILSLTGGTLLTFFPQLLAWYALTGNFLTSPYLTGNEGFSPLRPHILGVLFNVRNGLFLWTPATLIGVIGLIRSKRILYLAVFLLELYVVSTWSTWWQGASYSGRMFVSSLPILAFGIASIFAWLVKLLWKQEYYLLAIIIPLSVINAISIVYFLVTLPGR